MIKLDDLRDFRPDYMYGSGSEGITLQSIKDALKENAGQLQLPIAFQNDQVKYKTGLLSSGTDDCLIVYHPDHPKDYVRFCIRIKRQGSAATISVKQFGDSAQIKKNNIAEAQKQQRQGMSMSQKLGHMASGAIWTVGKNKNKLEEEQNYYGFLGQVFDSVIS